MWVKQILIISCIVLSSAHRSLLSGQFSINVRYQRPTFDEQRMMDFNPDVTPKQIHERIRETFGITPRSACGRGVKITYGEQTLEPDDETPLSAHEQLQISSGDEDNNLLIEQVFIPDYVLLINIFHPTDHQTVFGEKFLTHILPKNHDSNRIYRYLTLDRAPPGRNIRIDVDIPKNGDNTRIMGIYVKDTKIKHGINWKCVPQHIENLDFCNVFDDSVNAVDLSGIYTPNLKALTINSNRNVHNINLSPSFSASVQLRKLDLRLNRLQHLDLSSITPEFTSLRQIDLSHNYGLRSLDLEPLRAIQSNIAFMDIEGNNMEQLYIDPISELVSKNRLKYIMHNNLAITIWIQYEGFIPALTKTIWTDIPKWSNTEALYNYGIKHAGLDRMAPNNIGDIAMIHNGRIITRDSSLNIFKKDDTVIFRNTIHPLILRVKQILTFMGWALNRIFSPTEIKSLTETVITPEQKMGIICGKDIFVCDETDTMVIEVNLNFGLTNYNQGRWTHIEFDDFPNTAKILRFIGDGIESIGKTWFPVDATLEHLEFRNTSIKRVSFLASPTDGWKHLKAIVFHNNHRLEEIDLMYIGNGLDPRSPDPSKMYPNLRIIDIQQNPVLTTVNLPRCALSLPWAPLTHLYLNDNGLTKLPQITKLLEPTLSSLELVDLRNNNLNDESSGNRFSERVLGPLREKEEQSCPHETSSRFYKMYTITKPKRHQEKQQETTPFSSQSLQQPQHSPDINLLIVKKMNYILNNQSYEAHSQKMHEPLNYKESKEWMNNNNTRNTHVILCNL